MEKVRFKSTKEFFIKELSGLKNNTVRFKDEDERFNLLDKFEKGELEFLEIEIALVGDEDKVFTRNVTDVSKYQDLYIITFEQVNVILKKFYADFRELSRLYSK